MHTKHDYTLQVIGLPGTWRRDFNAINLQAAINLYMHALDNDGGVCGLNDGASYDIEVLVDNTQKLHVQVKIVFRPSFTCKVLDNQPDVNQQSWL